MAQWDVYANPVARAQDEIPYLVVVQSDLLSALPTRVVVPLSRSAVRARGLPDRMAPRVEVVGETLVPKPHEAGPIAARALGRPVGNLKAASFVIIDALDAVISGV